MTPLSGLRPIPWAFINHDLMKRWVWQTPHFEVVVTSDFNSYSWVVTDLMKSADGLFLTEGRTRDFQTTENEVREAIGKSYPAKLGYREYAGGFASTFTIATGARLDFAQHSGQVVVVKVRMPDGTDQPFVGTVRAVNYEVHVTPESGSAVRIQPSHIVEVTSAESRRGGNAPAFMYTGMGRVYTGGIVRGCNGLTGFMPNTVDHNGAHCSVHEDTLVRY